MLHQGFQLIPMGEGGQLRFLGFFDKVAISFYFPLSSSTNLNNPKIPLSLLESLEIWIHR